MKYMGSENWTELAVAACDHAGVDCGSIEAITTWDQKFVDGDGYRNNAVFRIGGRRCLKIYGPTSQRQFHVERAALQTLADHNGIPAPRFVAGGERAQGRPYLIMTEIPGSSAEAIWDQLPRSDQLVVAREIGAITAAIHRLPQDELAAVEEQFGGRREEIARQQAERIAEIEAAGALSARQRDELMHFVRGEALEFINAPPVLTHYDFSHAHIFLARENDTSKVTGFIDWGEAMLGPPEWDIAYHWFWTFSGDREAMAQCLQAYYADNHRPEQLAWRCLATHLYTFSMGLLWPSFAKDAGGTGSIVHEMVESFFPAAVFGLPALSTE
jgi:hygromycin-B 7''-O-kinase